MTGPTVLSSASEPRVTARRVVLALLIAAAVCGVFMALRPGWGTVESVSGWHRFFQVAKWSFAVGAILMEAGSLYYSSRRDYLQGVQSQQRQALEDKIRADAERRVREAEEVAARARAEAAALAGRHFTAEQGAVFKRVLAKTHRSHVEIISGDSESLQYADQLANALRAAGWSANSHSGIGMWDYIPHHGNVLQFRGAATEKDNMETERIADLRPHGLIPAEGQALAEALDEAGITTKFAIMHGGDRGQMQLFIGYKP